MIQDNLDYVLTTTLDKRRNTETLHLIDANPTKGKPLNYNYAYTSFDTFTGVTTHGILITNHPSIEPEGRLYNRYSPSISTSKVHNRHYFDAGESVVREDKVKNNSFEFLPGSGADPSEVADLDLAMALAEFQIDVHNILTGTPIRPLTDLLHQHIELYVRPTNKIRTDEHGDKAG